MIGAAGSVGFSLVNSFAVVLILLAVVAFEGLVHPCLTALMTKEVPDDAQGELQGGLASVTNLASLFSALFFTQAFGWFMRENAPVQRPGAPFLICAVIMLASLIWFLSLSRRRKLAH